MSKNFWLGYNELVIVEKKMVHMESWRHMKIGIQYLLDTLKKE